MSTPELDGVRAIVTGGASGIGLATATELASRGAKVVCLDLNAEVAEPLVGVRCDVTDKASVEAAVSSAVEILGGLDAVVNNAGIGAQGTVEDNDDDEWERVLDVNLMGLVRISRAVLPHLRASDNASITNLCSIAATAGLQQRALYSASKGAVLALTQAMAADHVREGIRVNGVCPGTTNTPWVGRLLEKADDPAAERAALAARQPTGRLVEADEVAYAIANLVSPRSRAVVGTMAMIDGGMQALRVRPAS